MKVSFFDLRSNGISAPVTEAPKAAAPVPKAEAPAPAPVPAAAAKPAPASKPAAKPAAKKEPVAKPAVTPAAPAFAGARTEENVKMSRMRLRIAERLKESQNTAASLTTFNEIDMSNIIEFRNKYKDGILKEHGIKLGFMSAFIKSACYAMKHVPVVNARIEEDQVVYPSYVDISVAVATPKGLVTPVLRDCQTMSFLDIERSLAEMAGKARDNKISIEDMAGGTFTISNGGVFGSMFGTPIINMPQAAILGMHAVKERPVVINGKVRHSDCFILKVFFMLLQAIMLFAKIVSTCHLKFDQGTLVNLG
jgi:2-oxoglutarate dehydrogenase E2 component (dihydrolipoamide succinyltransferase)